MKNEVDEFLQGLDQAPEDPFQPTTEDPFANTPVEEKQEESVEEDAAEATPLPFHKDPKVQRYVEKQIAKALEGLPQQRSVEREFREDTAATVGDDEVMDVLTRIIGNDTPEKVSAAKDLKKVLSGLEEKGAQRALQQLDAQARERDFADREAEEELDNYFEAIEDTYGVDITSNAPAAARTRSEFVDFVKRISPKNADGEVTEFPDLVQAYDIFKDRKQAPARPNRAKELSSRSMARSTDASTAPVTGKSWKDVDRLFDKLK